MAIQQRGVVASTRIRHSRAGGRARREASQPRAEGRVSPALEPDEPGQVCPRPSPAASQLEMPCPGLHAREQLRRRVRSTGTFLRDGPRR